MKYPISGGHRSSVGGHRYGVEGSFLFSDLPFSLGEADKKRGRPRAARSCVLGASGLGLVHQVGAAREEPMKDFP